MIQDKFDLLRALLLLHPSDFPTRKTHIAGIWKRNKLISIGFNSKKSHPLQFKYKSRNERIFLHAELSAIHAALRVIGVDQFKYCTLVVIRLDFKGNPANSKPCSGCLRAIAEFGFKEYYHS